MQSDPTKRNTTVFKCICVNNNILISKHVYRVIHNVCLCVDIKKFQKCQNSENRRPNKMRKFNDKHATHNV